MTLFGDRGLASLAPRICLEAAGADYRFVVPNRDPTGPSPAAFVAASPHLKVPALIDGDLMLTEAAAIVMHIADRFPEAMLAPPIGTDLRGEWYRWMVWLQNTPMATLYRWFYPERFCGVPGREEDVRADAVARLDGMFDWVDGELAGRDHLVGDTFSGADAMLWMLIRWSRNMPRPAFARPNLGRYWLALRGHAPVATVIGLEDL